MDRDEYFHKLKSLTQHLDQEVKDKIYYDLIKLEEWFWPNLDELKIYLDKLTYFTIHEWKFILLEFKNIYHISIRNEFIIKLLKMTRKYRIYIKLFQIVGHVMDYLDFYEKVDRRFLMILKLRILKKYTDGKLKRKINTIESDYLTSLSFGRDLC